MVTIERCWFLTRMDLELVEALTIYALHITLRHKGIRVDLVDELENHMALTTLCHNEKHLDLTTGMETVGFDHCCTTMRIDCDA